MTRPLRERRPHDASGPSYLAVLIELRRRDAERAKHPKPSAVARVLRALRGAA